MMHELYVYWIMFWSMPEWIQAIALLSIGAFMMWISTKLNVVK